MKCNRDVGKRLVTQERDVELIVVLLVLGILAAIAVPTFNTLKQKSAERTFQSNVQSIARNANAISASETTGGETTLAHVATAAGELAGVTVADGVITGVIGSYECTATITIVANQAVIASDDEAACS